MFIEFEFRNFRSFRDGQTFSMEAAPLRNNDSGMEEGNVFDASNFRLLKSKAIYGSNASGKSNLAKAIAAFCTMVSKSVVQEKLTKQIWDDRFQLISNWDDQSIYFQYIFLFRGGIYRYGFQILNEKITYEWLYTGTHEDEIEYFMRSPEGLKLNEKYVDGFEDLQKHGFGSSSELFREDSLFLTAAALLGNLFFADIRDNIRGILAVDGVNDRSTIGFAMNKLMKGTVNQIDAIKKFLSAADTGIENIEVVEIAEKQTGKSVTNAVEDREKAWQLYSFHSRYDDNGQLVDRVAVPFAEWESAGTKKMLGVGALILSALSSGKTIVIDEFDARFHPNLTLKIVQMFNSSASNPYGAQIIFVTHDSGLLRRAQLRRDQICLVDKDKYGISSMTNLIEFKGVRKDASYEKEYLNGSYSAVPFLDELDEIVIKKQNWDDLQKAE